MFIFAVCGLGVNILLLVTIGHDHPEGHGHSHHGHGHHHHHGHTHHGHSHGGTHGHCHGGDQHSQADQAQEDAVAQVLSEARCLKGVLSSLCTCPLCVRCWDVCICIRIRSFVAQSWPAAGLLFLNSYVLCHSSVVRSPDCTLHSEMSCSQTSNCHQLSCCDLGRAQGLVTEAVICHLQSSSHPPSLLQMAT
jgi:hypothetical protein